MPKHCLCDAISTKADPPETGRRVQAYGNGWEFITWHNGDQEVFCLWRDDMDQHPCERIIQGQNMNQNQQQRKAMDDQLPNTSTIRWMPVDVKCSYLPDPKKEILIYDGRRGVVVGWVSYPKGFEIGDNPRNIRWCEKRTGIILADPKWWADVSYPEGEKE
jgi:hypothetical protein